MPYTLQRRFNFCLLAIAIIKSVPLVTGQIQPQLDWQGSTAGVVFSSPAIDESGVIYIGSNDNSLHAFNSNGSLKWTYSTGNWVDSTPTIGEDGIIYVGSWDNKLHAVNPSNGSALWTFETNNYITASPVIGSNGLICFGSKDSVFYAINQDGTLAWEYFAGEPIFASAAIGEDGTIYFGDEGGVFHALNSDGSEKWTFQTEVVTDANNSILSSPAIDNLGNLYFGCGNGYCYSLADNGSSASLNWKYLTGDRVDSSPVLGLNDEVFFAGRDGYLRSLPTFSTTSENVANWEELVGDVFYCSPVVDESGRVYIIAYAGGGENHLFCMNADGTKHWDSSEAGFPFSIEGVVDSSLALTSDEKLYFGCYDSKLYCVNLDTGPAASDWPTFQHSPNRNGAWPSFTVTVTVSPTGSGQVTGSGTFAHGSSVSLTAQPSIHHLFSRWLNGESSLSSALSYSIELNSNLHLTAEFIETFNLSLTAGQGGQVSPETGQRYQNGSSVSIEATPDTGYSFGSWSGEGVLDSTDPTTEVIMNDDREISATFNLNTYTLSISTTSGGSASGGNTYEHGSNANIFATAEDGYAFSGWSGDGVLEPDQASTTVSMTEERNITANFQIQSYQLTVLAGEGGSVSAGGSFEHGTSKVITATPNEGYSFSEWSGEGISDSSDMNTTVLMTESRTVSAVFQRNSYNLQIVAGSGGSVEGNGTYEHGTIATIAATPDTGFVFTGWTGATVNDPSEPSTSIEVTQNYNLTASFSPRTVDKLLLIINSSPTVGGSTSGAGEYAPDSVVEISATPQTGYSFTGWSGTAPNDVNGANTSITLSSDLNLTANFAINSYDLAISSSSGGSTSGSQTYDHGTIAIVSASPETGYFFSGWSGTGITNPSSPQTTVLMTEDRNLAATFTPYSYTLSVLPEEGGSVTGANNYDYGTHAQITASPSTGYHFDGWTGGGINDPSNPNTTVLMTEDRTAQARFSKIQIQLSISAMEGGSVPASDSYDYGSTISLVAQPSEGFEFSHWEGSSVSNPNSASTSIKLIQDSSLTAVFKRQPGYWNDGWLGFVLQSDEDWMYIFPLGWMYSLTDQTKFEYWLWHSSLGWLWFERNTYAKSQIWMSSASSWIFIDATDWQNPSFYDYATKSWSNF